MAELEGCSLNQWVALEFVLRFIDEAITGLESTNKDFIPSFADQSIFVRKLGIGWVLCVWISESISDSDTFEV